MFILTQILACIIKGNFIRGRSLNRNKLNIYRNNVKYFKCDKQRLCFTV